MKNYDAFFRQLTANIRPHENLVRLIQYLNNVLTKLMYVIYPVLLAYLYLKRNQSLLILCILIPGISFSALTLIRKQYNQPRPYETWDIEPLIERLGVGKSFPSRHVFSATIISMCVLRVSVLLGILCLLLSILLAVVRVLGGVHYPKDVIVGFGLGVLFGLGLFFN